MNDPDLLIVGAGCAGLSLAWHLVEQGLDGRRVLLVDSREEYRRDRTWCFFDVVPHPFEAQVSHRWPRWRVRERRESAWIERRAAGLRYAHLPADAFYDRVRARLRAEDGVELRLGVDVDAVADQGSHVEVHTSDGVLRAGLAFDSRPPQLQAMFSPWREVSLLQHFVGWEIEVDEDRFDPELATLMDFGVPQVGGVHFFYVLPLSERRALVEATWFGTHVPDEAVYRASIEGYLREVLRIARWAVVRRERGVLPMSSTTLRGRISERVYRIGLLGGMAKPSTGYAFLAIQAFSADLARRLKSEAVPAPPAPRSWRSRFQDRIFLSYLVRNRHDAPGTLVGLFERVEPRVLARFLNDRQSLVEDVAVMKAMPILPMTTEMVRATPLWLRP